MTTVEPNDLHTGWHFDTGPLGVDGSFPLLFVEALVVVVKESNTVDVALFGPNVYLHGANDLRWVHLIDLWLRRDASE